METETWTPTQAHNPPHTTCLVGKMCWGNGGTEHVGVDNGFLEYIEAHPSEEAQALHFLDGPEHESR